MRSRILAVAVLCAGCGIELDDEPVDSLEQQATTPSYWQTFTGITPLTVAWSSGATSNLSAWKTLDCGAKYGVRYFLDGVTVYREQSSNLDEFIARMDVMCRNYTFSDFGTGPSGGVKLASVYGLKYRTPSYSESVRNASIIPSDNSGDYCAQSATSSGPFPMGMKLAIDSGGNYVKNVGLHFGCYDTSRGYLFLHDGDMDLTIPNYSGNTVHLDCSPGYVSTGVAVRYDTGNGKIRDIKVLCMDLYYGTTPVAVRADL